MSLLTQNYDTSENTDVNEEKSELNEEKAKQNATEGIVEENKKVEKQQQSENRDNEQILQESANAVIDDFTTDDMYSKANALLDGLRKLKDEIRQERMKRKYSEDSPTVVIPEVKENTMENYKTDQEKLSEKDNEYKREEENDDEKEDEQNEVRKNNDFKENIKQNYVWIDANINQKIREQLERFKESKEQEKDVDELPNLGTHILGKLDEVVEDSLDVEIEYDNKTQDFPQDHNNETHDFNHKTRDKNHETKDENHETNDKNHETKDNNHETNDCNHESKDKNNENHDYNHKTNDNNHETHDNNNHETKEKIHGTIDNKHQTMDKNHETSDNNHENHENENNHEINVDENHETKNNHEIIEETLVKNADSLETLISEMNQVFKQEIETLLNKKTS